MRKTTTKPRASKRNQLHKCATGIKGFDEITEGGLPKNRTTLICGAAGSGKPLLGIDFLINGASNYNEPGAFPSFEETEDELYNDVGSLNLDLEGLVSKKKFFLSMWSRSTAIFKKMTSISKVYSSVWNMPSAPSASFCLLNRHLQALQTPGFSVWK